MNQILAASALALISGAHFGRLAAGSSAANHAFSPTIQDSILADVVTQDSASRLSLSRTEIVFAFTDRGAATVEKTVDNSLHGDSFSNGMSSYVRASASDGVRGMRMEFPLSEISQVRCRPGKLTLEMNKRIQHKTNGETDFTIDGVADRKCAAFAEKFRMLKLRT